METLINEMLATIASNQTIMKYVVYDTVSTDPLTLPDVENAYQYIYTGRVQTPNEMKKFRLFPTPFNPNIEEEKKTFILCRIVPRGTNPNKPTEKEFVVYFDVVCHKDLWTIIGGKLRPFRICEEINDLWNKRLTPNSINKMFPIKEDYIHYNNQFAGYSIGYMGTWFNKFAEQVELENV